MGVHSLVTGLPGAGKTLYTVATKLRPMVESTIDYQGHQIPRRLVIGGIPDLLLPHEIMVVPEIDPERASDEWAHLERERGAPAVEWVKRVDGAWKACAAGDAGAEPLECSILTWWAWCQPGDVIVVDEAQRVFRPMAAGKKIPRFIARLETARHYGVEFIFLTQHPQLLHVNVRNLVGPHEDVRRIFGSHRVMVYLWDRCSNPDRISKATGRIWKHDKSAYALYKSSELHTKFGQKLPIAVFALLGGVILLASLIWVIYGRLSARYNSAPPESNVEVKSGAVAGIKDIDSKPDSQARYSFDLDALQASFTPPDPFYGFVVQWQGGYDVGGAQYRIFSLIKDGKKVAHIDLAQLVAAGYVWTEYSSCSGLLTFPRLGSRRVTCQPAQEPSANYRPPSQAASPDAPASLPSLQAAFN